MEYKKLVDIKQREVELTKEKLYLIEERIAVLEDQKAPAHFSLVESFNKAEEHFTRRLYHKERKKRIYLERHPLQVFAFMCVCLLIAGASQLFNVWNEHRVSANDAAAYSYDHTAYFISQIASSAIAIAEANDLYASVMIAQAVHESASGTSGLAAPPHYNLFGIKGQSSTGGYVTMTTWEDDGAGNTYTIDDQFRSYGSWYESLADYASILSWSYYDGVHRSYAATYQEATAFLTGRYATDTSYNLKLNNIIETYNLTQYDNYSIIAENTLIWNKYRKAYTSQTVLEEDQNWASYNGRD